MKKGGIGGANTKTGLVFELKTNLVSFLSKQHDYSISKLNNYSNSFDIFFKNKKVARTFPKHDLYKFLKIEFNLDWENVLSKKLLPDDALYVLMNNTVYIIEQKNQEVEGSVDEKLQTCDFKKKQYKKVFSRINFEVEYIYLLSRWFENPKYKDTLDYVISVGCQYYFEYIPLQKLGLPVPKI
jgi:hypothetical protein